MQTAKSINYFLIIIIQFLFASQSVCGQSSEYLQFEDGSSLPVVNNLYKNISLIEISDKEIIVRLNSIGKGPLSKEILNKVKKQNHKLFFQLRKINTAYQVSQDEKQFYISGLDSINYEKLRDCQKCLIKCRLIIMKLTSNGEIYYIPIIKSIQRLKDK